MPAIKRSTRDFLKVANQIPGFPLLEKLHGYFYMRFPYLYIGIGTGEHRISPIFNFFVRLFSRLFPSSNSGKAFADTYHGKVIRIDTAKKLVSIKEDINISYPEQAIPYSLARDLILQKPERIAVMDCPCRSARKKPCLPIDVCLIIGEPFTSLVLDHHPNRSRLITQTEAMQILEDEERRGHVHHAFFKQAMIGRFYAICNCCSCCCGAMHAHQNGTPMLASSGYVSRVRKELCIACEECLENCQFFAITMSDDTIFINEESCMGCGICVSHCPQGALELTLAPNKGEPLAIPPGTKIASIASD
ncbi:MAG: 4Fe-4S binding protein [Anaerolineaceae bacterium]|nr:4Fe-4S binding protein [Anaerolineaceae bacterium]